MEQPQQMENQIVLYQSPPQTCQIKLGEKMPWTLEWACVQGPPGACYRTWELPEIAGKGFSFLQNAYRILKI